MDRFQAMQVFARVVEANSFTRAADGLALPRTTVTTVIQNLERHLGVRLLNRTTRRISLTPDGAAYYKHATRILAEVEETEACFQDAALRPRGRLRIDVPAGIGQLILIPALCEFHDRHPDIELVIGMGDRRVDLVQEAVDCVIRIGELEDSSLVARRIGVMQTLTCAAPSYLERHGVPQSLEALQYHQAVHYFSSSGRNCSWTFMVDGKERATEVRGVVSVNDWGAHLACGLQGFGLIQTARFMVLPHLRSGQLVEVLPQWQPPSLPISLLYLQHRQLSPKVRVFSDWVAELFARCPLLSGDGAHDKDFSGCGIAPAVLLPAGEYAARHQATQDIAEAIM
ncbi:LysR substrate-binding domain-containing protein [Bordetella trematum]|uniref:LysR substrate-binding domain-containing protein n=1 Tax=Bordetella trematum TaxID=123899 RepID=UPI0013FE3815